MTSHPWLTPSAALTARVARARATAALRGLSGVPAHRLGTREAAWAPLLAALPALLRADSGHLLAVVARVDVLTPLIDLAAGSVDADRLERALVTLWLGIAGHRSLTSPLALAGPFRGRVVDPHAPRLLALGEARGLIATAQGPVVIGRAGRLAVDRFVAAPLATLGRTVVIDDQFNPPDAEVVARTRTALAAAGAALPGGSLERVTIGAGDAAFGESRVSLEVDPGDVVASAQAAFVRAAATIEPVISEGGVLVESGRCLSPTDLVARACASAVALPWRGDRAAAAVDLADDLDELAVLAAPTPAGAALVAAIEARVEAAPHPRRRVLLVNIDADDFVYSFQFGRSVERRCRERRLRVDRLVVGPGVGLDLAAELGRPVPAPVADGIEFRVASEQDSSVPVALRRLSSRRYDAVVANVRPPLFYDLFTSGMLAPPTLLWDRHLHGGLREEGLRRGIGSDRLRGLPMRAWSLADSRGQGLHRNLAEVGLEQGCGHVWPMDLQFFQTGVTREPTRLFAGGNNGRDWPLFVEAIRELPLDVHLVTGQAPVDLPPHVHLTSRLPLWRFRDAMGAAPVMALPLLPNVAAGVTVLPMAMALGVAVVATHTTWTEQYVTDGEDGLLVPAGDVRGFRDALVRLYEQPDLRERLVANARRRVAALCDLEAFTREMFATLESAGGQ
jgi:glycosyl transferase family 1